MGEEVKSNEGDEKLTQLIRQVVVSKILSEEEKANLFKRAMQMIEEDTEISGSEKSV